MFFLGLLYGNLKLRLVLLGIKWELCVNKIFFNKINIVIWIVKVWIWCIKKFVVFNGIGNKVILLFIVIKLLLF